MASIPLEAYRRTQSRHQPLRFHWERRRMPDSLIMTTGLLSINSRRCSRWRAGIFRANNHLAMVVVEDEHLCLFCWLAVKCDQACRLNTLRTFESFTPKKPAGARRIRSRMEGVSSIDADTIPSAAVQHLSKVPPCLLPILLHN